MTAGRECLGALGARVTEAKAFADRSLIMGVPAKLGRKLSDEDVAKLYESAQSCAERGARYHAERAVAI